MAVCISAQHPIFAQDLSISKANQEGIDLAFLLLKVAIARGKYTAAMDMWSLGCIFGELIQRMERSGIITPQLRIGPVFKLAEDAYATVKTPPSDSVYEQDHSSIARRVCILP